MQLLAQAPEVSASTILPKNLSGVASLAPAPEVSTSTISTSLGATPRTGSGGDFFAAKSFDGAKRGYVFRTGQLGVGYYWDATAMQSVDRERSVTSDGCDVAVQYVWLDYVSKSDSWVAGMVNDHMGNLAGSGRWRLPLHDLIFGAGKAGDSGTGRLPRQRANKIKRVKRSGMTAGGNLPTFVDASSSLHKDLGLWAVDTVNPNGWSGMLKYLSQSSAEVVLGQESKVCSGDSKVAAEKAAATSGWGAVLSPARVTDAGGISSGVMCAAKSFIGMARNTCSDIPDLFMSRICCAHVGSICKGGVHFVSLYF